MKSELTTGKGLGRQLDITVPAAEVAKRFSAQLEGAAKNVKIDGFRPGKAPANVVKDRVGKQVAAEVAHNLVREFLPQAVTEHKLNIAGEPRVHNGGTPETFFVEEGKDFTFHVQFDVYPTFKPEGYTGLKLTRETAEADEAVVQTALDRLAVQLRNFAEKKGGATKGDRVTMTGQGYKVSGKGKDKTEEAFAGGDLKDFAVVLGSGQLIPGFEDGLEDVKAGDQLDLEVNFPENYHAKELAGAPAKFKLTITKVEAPVDEALTDETVKPLGFDSLDALKDVLRKSAAREIAQASEQRLKRALLDALADANTAFELPESLIQAEHAALWRAQLQELQQRGLPIEALGKTPDEVIAELKPLAERRVRLGLVLAEIAKTNDIKVETADIDTAIRNQMQMAGPQAEQVKQYFSRPEARQQLAGPILEEKTTAWIISKANVTEKKIPATELLAELA